MTKPTPHQTFPDPDDRQRLNAALTATDTDTGFCDDHGRPAPRPDDIDQWTPTSNPVTPEPGQPPF